MPDFSEQSLVTDPKPTVGNSQIRINKNQGKRSSGFKAHMETVVTEDAVTYKEKKNQFSKGAGKGLSKGEKGKSQKEPALKPETASV
jgi:hypothetical protein